MDWKKLKRYHNPKNTRLPLGWRANFAPKFLYFTRCDGQIYSYTSKTKRLFNILPNKTKRIKELKRSKIKNDKLLQVYVNKLTDEKQNK